MKKAALIVLLFLFFWTRVLSSSILIPMDELQKNHLKAYGLAYWALKGELEIHWLLNYRGGALLARFHSLLTYVFVSIAVVAAVLMLGHGSAENLAPLLPAAAAVPDDSAAPS